jgi:hypothetical protein
LYRPGGAAVRLDLTIFDPDLDPDGRYERELARAIVEMLGRA